MHLGGNRRSVPLFFQRDGIPILVSRTVKTRKLKLLYIREWELVQRFIFGLSST